MRRRLGVGKGLLDLSLGRADEHACPLKAPVRERLSFNIFNDEFDRPHECDVA